MPPPQAGGGGRSEEGVADAKTRAPVAPLPQPPFEGMSPVDAARAAAYERRRPILGPGLAPEVVALLRDCWHPTPSSRPIFEVREMVAGRACRPPAAPM